MLVFFFTFFSMHLSLSTCAPVRVDFQDIKVFGDKGDQGLTAETCCAEENKINYQIDSLGVLSKKRSGKIDWEEYLPPLKYLIAISLWNFLSDSVFMRHFVILIILWPIEGIVWPPSGSRANTYNLSSLYSSKIQKHQSYSSKIPKYLLLKLFFLNKN